MTASNTANWQQQAHQYLLRGDYSQAAKLYEQAIAESPDIHSHYWHLGLMLLLQNQETEAQMTWLLAMEAGEAAQIEQWTGELMQVLQTEAQRRESLADNAVAWAIRQHMREINPGDVNNLLHLIWLAIELGTFTGEELQSLDIIEIIQSESSADCDFNLLMEVLQKVLDENPLHPFSLEFAEACIPHVREPYIFIDILILNSVKIAYSAHKPALAARFLELALRFEEVNIEVLIQLTGFYQDAGDYAKGIEIAKFCYF